MKIKKMDRCEYCGELRESKDLKVWIDWVKNEDSDDIPNARLKCKTCRGEN
jgi:hypothetical protein